MSFRSASVIIGAFLFGIVVGWFVSWLPARGHLRDASVVSQGPTIEQVKQLAELITTRVMIGDVLHGTTTEETAEIIYLVSGDCDYAIDLTRVQVLEKDEKARRALIRVPGPHIVRPRVNHEKSRTYSLKSHTWRPWVDDRDKLRDETLQKAQKTIADTAQSPELMDQARRHAQDALQTFYRVLGWDVRVQFAAPESLNKSAS